MNKLKARKIALKNAPLPTAEDSRRLWVPVQIALAAWLKVHFAPAYRQMEVRKINEKMKRRAVAIQDQMQRERVNSLRSAIGLRHLKKIVRVGVQAPTKSRAPSPNPKATESSPPASST